ncbi:MAG: glycine--tRNA ligase subunit beta, partial [Armatimonadota bacterium]
MKADLLFEIGVEEIPAGVVLPALEQLREYLAMALDRARLDHGEVRVLGTPRRLAALIADVAVLQADAVTEHKGPPAQQAFD